MKRLFFICALTALAMPAVRAHSLPDIVTVQKVSVETTAGNAPRLPYRLWVDYDNGKGEYRQVRWLNSGEATEAAEANPAINPPGTEYQVRGFIIGDNTTPNGYPVAAAVKVVHPSPLTSNP